jgi:hypothetical protein
MEQTPGAGSVEPTKRTNTYGPSTTVTESKNPSGNDKAKKEGGPNAATFNLDGVPFDLLNQKSEPEPFLLKDARYVPQLD